MFESLSYMMLQQYCWMIVSLLGGILMSLMFVQGGQTLVYAVDKTEEEHKLIVNSLGRKWVFTFLILIAFGGALFVSFPLYCATCIKGTCLLWMMIPLCFTVQTAMYEFGTAFAKQKLCNYVLFFSGMAGITILGTTMGTFFNGAMYSINDMNIVRWETPFRGIEAILNPHNLLLGATAFLLSRVLALLFFIKNIKNEQIITRSKIRLMRNAISFIACFIAFLVWLLVKDGFYYDPATKEVSMVAYKFFKNLIAMPVVLTTLIAGITLVMVGITGTLVNNRFIGGIWYAGSGTVLAVLALFLIAGFNNTSYYPSLYDLQDSLTIENSSSGHKTLAVTGYVSLVIPVVMAFVCWKWRRKNTQNNNINI